MHFNLFYLIFQKALGKSREYCLNTLAGGEQTRSPSCVPPSPARIHRAETPSLLRTQRSRRTPGGPNFRTPRRHPSSRIHVPAVTGPRQRLQTQRSPPLVVGQPLWEESREALGRVGCKSTGHPPLHDCLGAPAQCPHPVAGGRHPGAED